MHQRIWLRVAGASALVVAVGAPTHAAYIDSFPSADSTRFTQLGQRFWNDGDFVQEAFLGTGLSSVQQVSLDLSIEPNSLAGDTQDMIVLLNGDQIGSYMIAPGDTLIDLDLTGFDVSGFGLSGDDYLLRLETIRTVSVGAGSAGILDGVQNLTFNQVPEPATFVLATIATAMLVARRRG